MQKIIQIFGGVVLLTFISCKTDVYKTDVALKAPDIQIKRFEQDLFSLDLNKLLPGIDSLKKVYGNFPELFSTGIINVGSIKNPLYSDYLTRFLTDYMIYNLYEDVNSVFPDVKKIELALENSFAYYLHYFPGKTVPEIITFIGGFNHSIAVDDSLIAIGLDKYMGSNYETYRRLGYSNYVKYNMKPDRIPIDCMRAWAETEWVFNTSAENLINRMIHEGKIQFFLKSMFPSMPDSTIMGYTAEQIKFCEKNEPQMWMYLIENKLLFSTDVFVINKYVNDAPFTKGFSNNSPGKAAVWIGWRIVEEYMKKNKEVNLRQLMENVNYQQILTQSNYHP